MAIFKKDPDAVLDYPFDWGPYLIPVGDTIASVEWVLSAGLTKVSQTNTPTKAVIFVSGGVLDETETITCRITTTASPTPRVDDRTIFLKIVTR